MEKLTVDEAMAEFRKLLQAKLDDEPALLSDADGPETPEDADEWRLSMAEILLRTACRDVTRCGDHLCRRSGRCRHLTHLAAVRKGPRYLPDKRCSASVEAVRHAVWVAMNALVVRLASESDHQTKPKGRRARGRH